MSLQRTNESHTKGIVNLPLLRDTNGKVVMKRNDSGNMVSACDGSSRYLFFELDTLELEDFNKVVDLYKANRIPVYIHRSMRGFHFLSVTPLRKELYQILLRQIKPLNPKCPHVTIRIVPNKWIGEKAVFHDGSIIAPTFNKELADLKENMERGKIWRIQQLYKVVTYRQEGLQGDL